MVTLLLQDFRAILNSQNILDQKVAFAALTVGKHNHGLSPG